MVLVLLAYVKCAHNQLFLNHFFDMFQLIELLLCSIVCVGVHVGRRPFVNCWATKHLLMLNFSISASGFWLAFGFFFYYFVFTPLTTISHHYLQNSKTKKKTKILWEPVRIVQFLIVMLTWKLWVNFSRIFRFNENLFSFEWFDPRDIFQTNIIY